MFSNSWYLVKGGSCKQDIPVGMGLHICLEKQCPVSATVNQCKQGNIDGEIRKSIHHRKSPGHECRQDQLKSDKRMSGKQSSLPFEMFDIFLEKSPQVAQPEEKA